MPAAAYRIETPRTVVRCYRATDAQFVLDATTESLESLRKWMPWADDEPTSVEEKVKLLRTFRSQFDGDQDYIYGVFTRDESRLLGGAGLHRRIGPKALEIGYWIRSSEQRKGYAKETIGALVAVGFQCQGVERLEVHCDAANSASAGVPKALGFHLDATLRKRRIHDNRLPCDLMVWSLFPDEVKFSFSEYQAFDATGKPLKLH